MISFRALYCLNFVCEVFSMYSRARLRSPDMQTGTSRGRTGNDRLLAQSAAPKLKLLDQVRQAIRARRYSKRTERSYADWIKRFILFTAGTSADVWQRVNSLSSASRA